MPPKKARGGGRARDADAGKNGRGNERAAGKRGGGKNDEHKSNWTAFSDQLRPLKLKCRPIKKDGNCLFRSLGDQLEGSQDRHMTYRKETVQFMRNNPDDFMPFIEGDWDVYCKKMERDSTWGGNLELAAIARRYRVNITIHQLEAPRFVIDCPGGGTGIQTIHLSYHLGEHYSSVRSDHETSAFTGTNIDLDARLKRAGVKTIPVEEREEPQSKNEKIVMDTTQCYDIPHIRELLKETANDVDAVIEIIIGEQVTQQEDEDAKASSSGSSSSSGAPPVITGDKDIDAAIAASLASDPSPSSSSSSSSASGTDSKRSGGEQKRSSSPSSVATTSTSSSSSSTTVAAKRSSSPAASATPKEKAKATAPDICVCGSGKKYKKCCLPAIQALADADTPSKGPGGRRKKGGGGNDEDSNTRDDSPPSRTGKFAPKMSSKQRKEANKVEKGKKGGAGGKKRRDSDADDVGGVIQDFGSVRI